MRAIWLTVVACVGIAACDGSGSGSASQTDAEAKLGDDAEATAPPDSKGTPDAGAAGQGGGAGASDAASGTPDTRATGGTVGQGGAVGADGGAPDGAKPAVDARAIAMDASPDALAPVPVPFMCAGLEAPGGMRPATCTHPAIAIQCVKVMGDPPYGPGVGACNLASGNYKLLMCVVTGYACMEDLQCCGTTEKRRCVKAAGAALGHCEGSS